MSGAFRLIVNSVSDDIAALVDIAESSRLVNEFISVRRSGIYNTLIFRGEEVLRFRIGSRVIADQAVRSALHF